MNLNDIAGAALAAAGVQPFEPVWWCRCLGQENIKGVVTPQYAPPVQLAVNVQTASDAALFHADMAGQNNTTRHLYVNDTAYGSVAGLVRQDETGGDMLFYKGGWWLVTAVPEDFSAQGWVKVRVTWQAEKPQGIEPPMDKGAIAPREAAQAGLCPAQQDCGKEPQA